jgi:acyl-CoA thioesterase-2
MPTDSELRTSARQARKKMLQHVIDDVLVLDAAGDDRFTTKRTASTFDRIYGGQILGQALMAAAATVDDERQVHSAHCNFLRLGDPTLPIIYEVERLRDTRRFSNRLVKAIQNDACCAVVMLSFCTRSEGFEHQWPMPETPVPEDLPSRDELLLAMHEGDLPKNAGVPWPIDIRHADRRPWDPEPSHGPNHLWMRADARLPDDPRLHAALLLYASDLTMSEAVIAQHPIRWQDLIAARGMFGASLDHAFFLHKEVRVNDWILHVQESSRAADGRGFASGRFYTRHGALVASVVQEIFIKNTTGGDS